MMIFKTLSVTFFRRNVPSSLMLLIALASAYVFILSIFARLSITFGCAAFLVGFCFIGSLSSFKVRLLSLVCHLVRRRSIIGLERSVTQCPMGQQVRVCHL